MNRQILLRSLVESPVYIYVNGACSPHEIGYIFNDTWKLKRYYTVDSIGNNISPLENRKFLEV